MSIIYINKKKTLLTKNSKHFNAKCKCSTDH